jgi:DNA-binding response OmpR family regulator
MPTASVIPNEHLDGHSRRNGDPAPSPSRSGPPRMAVIDRDSGLLVVLGKRLERLGWRHQVFAAPVSARKLASMRLDAVIVDLAIIGPRRWEWLERCCQARVAPGILVCTRHSTLAERVRGFELGIDDWLGKPCHPEELIARVEVAVRHQRPGFGAERGPVKVGEIEIRDEHQAFVGDSRLHLTRREFELLELFTGALDTVLERKLIYERVWGYPMVSRDDRSVDVFVYKLRQKLEVASPAWQYIHTHWGVGYRFSVEPSATPATRLAA